MMDIDEFDKWCATIPHHTEQELKIFITEEVEREENIRRINEYIQWGEDTELTEEELE